MKSAVLVANKKIEIQHRPYPLMDRDECMIKLICIGVCSSDIYRAFEDGAYHYPLVMGHELAGVIHDKGEDVVGLNIGQRVTVFPLKPCFNCAPCIRHDYAQCIDYGYYGSRSDGGYCDYLSVKSWNLMPIPSAVSMRDAALTEPLSVVVHALRRAGILSENRHSEKRVAILGAGFLGQLAVQIIRHLNPSIELMVLDRNLFKLELACKHGAKVLCLTTASEWRDALSNLAGKFEYVIEASGAPDNFIYSIDMTKQGGSLLWIGNVTDTVSMNKVVVSSILRKEISIFGTWNSSFKNPVNDDWKQSLQLMENGLFPSQFVTHVTDLENIPNILRNMYEHKTGGSKFEHIKCLIENK